MSRNIRWQQVSGPGVPNFDTGNAGELFAKLGQGLIDTGIKNREMGLKERLLEAQLADYDARVQGKGTYARTGRSGGSGDGKISGTTTANNLAGLASLYGINLGDEKPEQPSDQVIPEQNSGNLPTVTVPEISSDSGNNGLSLNLDQARSSIGRLPPNVDPALGGLSIDTDQIIPPDKKLKEQLNPNLFRAEPDTTPVNAEALQSSLAKAGIPASALQDKTPEQLLVMQQNMQQPKVEETDEQRFARLSSTRDELYAQLTDQKSPIYQQAFTEELGRWTQAGDDPLGKHAYKFRNDVDARAKLLSDTLIKPTEKQLSVVDERLKETKATKKAQEIYDTNKRREFNTALASGGVLDNNTKYLDNIKGWETWIPWEKGGREKAEQTLLNLYTWGYENDKTQNDLTRAFNKVLKSMHDAEISYTDWEPEDFRKRLSAELGVKPDIIDPYIVE